MARDTYTAVHEEWQDQPSEETPIMAADLEHIESGIKTAMDNRALREVYNDQSIRLSTGNEEPSPENIMSIELGYRAKAPASFAVAIGNNVEATVQNAVAIGSNINSSNSDAFVIGYGNKSSRADQFVCGRYNTDDTNAAFIIGYGMNENQRENIHTVDYQGNAYFKGDVANGQYSLNELGAQMGTISTDVTEECDISVTGQMLEVTVPLSLIMQVYGYYIVGGEFIGVIYYNSIPPMLFNMQISAVRNGEVHGKAVLTNLESSTTATYGYKFEGDIQLLFPYTTDPKAKVTFDLGRNATVQYFMVHRTAGSAIDFTISELRNEIMTYEETTTALNSQEAGEINKIPNVYAIRDWCKTLINPSEEA